MMQREPQTRSGTWRGSISEVRTLKRHFPSSRRATRFSSKLGWWRGWLWWDSFFGQLLAAAGERERAVDVLRTSAEASRRLGQAEQAEEAEQLIGQLTRAAGRRR